MSDLPKGDYLKSVPVMFSNWANDASLYGRATLTDNHGNSTIGFKLTCADGKTFTLNHGEVGQMHGNFWSDTVLSLRFDGVIPMRNGKISPLETECKKLLSPTKASRRGQTR